MMIPLLANHDLTPMLREPHFQHSQKKHLRMSLTYSKNPYIRTYNFEMSLLWFLFDETLLGTRVQVLNTGHKKNVRKRIVDGSKLQ